MTYSNSEILSPKVSHALYIYIYIIFLYIISYPNCLLNRIERHEKCVSIFFFFFSSARNIAFWTWRSQVSTPSSTKKIYCTFTWVTQLLSLLISYYVNYKEYELQNLIKSGKFSMVKELFPH